MTPREIVKEFKGFSTIEKAALLSELSRVMKEDLEQNNQSNYGDRAERTAAIERLKGIAKSENPSLTKQESKEEYYNYLAEKYS